MGVFKDSHFDFFIFFIYNKSIKIRRIIMPRTKITEDTIIEINELYLKIGTYAGVSRAMGGSPAPSTVKKYIISNYIPRKNIKKKTFQKEDLPEFNTDIFKGVDNWGDLCILSKEEKEEMKELWEELLI